MSLAEPANALVLIVDDDVDTREGYAEYLVAMGFRVDRARDGPEALSKIFELLPDVILMDLALPDIDGWEVTRRVKADGRTKSIPVIAVSARVFPSDIARAVRAGCDRFLAKPCYPHHVAEEILRLLQPRR